MNMKFVATALCVTYSIPLAAQSDGAGYIEMAIKALAAFECAAFAEYSYPDQRNAFLQLGFESGLGFIHAVKNDLLSEAELNKVPIGVLWRTQPPNADLISLKSPEFALGRISAFAEEQTMSKIVNSKAPTDQVEAFAKIGYAKKNCSLIR